MKDTRETIIGNSGYPKLPRVKADNENGEDIAPEHRPAPRFKVGDLLVMALRPDEPFTLRSEPRWDYEFSGWLIAPGCIGVHECNYILANERDRWEPHVAGLWSWWTAKE